MEKKIMKTAIQELIDLVEMDYNNGVEISMSVFHGMLIKALFKERQQIVEAYDDGYENGSGWPTSKGEKYYDRIFQNKDDSIPFLCE